jgi:hypothetical protein
MKYTELSPEREWFIRCRTTDIDPATIGYMASINRLLHHSLSFVDIVPGIGTIVFLFINRIIHRPSRRTKPGTSIDEGHHQDQQTCREQRLM